MSAIDNTEVHALVTRARDHLAARDDKQAARLLTDAVYHTHDPEMEQQVRQLAEQGLERAGRFNRGRWQEIIRIAELRTQGA
jgi:hypothetical protein